MGKPLLVGFNPRIVKEGPKVHIEEGTHRIIVEGHIDSVLFLHYEEKVDRSNGTYTVPSKLQVKDGHKIKGPAVTCIIVEQAGTERSMSIYLEKV